MSRQQPLQTEQSLKLLRWALYKHRNIWTKLICGSKYWLKFNGEQCGVKVSYLKLDYPKCEPLKFLTEKFTVKFKNEFVCLCSNLLEIIFKRHLHALRAVYFSEPVRHMSAECILAGFSLVLKMTEQLSAEDCAEFIDSLRSTVEISASVFHKSDHVGLEICAGKLEEHTRRLFAISLSQNSSLGWGFLLYPSLWFSGIGNQNGAPIRTTTPSSS